MLQAMVTEATYDDDIYGRDPTTVLLESEVAKLTGFEEALFTLSGTMGNQICLRTHLMQPPHSIVCDERTHVYALEAGGPAFFSQAMCVLVSPKNGKYLTLEDIKPKIVGEDVHFAPTRIVSLENTINGVVLPYEEAKRISEYVRSEFQGEIKLHLDGKAQKDLLIQALDCGMPLSLKRFHSSNIARFSIPFLFAFPRGYLHLLARSLLDHQHISRRRVILRRRSGEVSGILDC